MMKSMKQPLDYTLMENLRNAIKRTAKLIKRWRWFQRTLIFSVKNRQVQFDILVHFLHFSAKKMENNCILNFRAFKIKSNIHFSNQFCIWKTLNFRAKIRNPFFRSMIFFKMVKVWLSAQKFTSLRKLLWFEFSRQNCNNCILWLPFISLQ